jgi:hypothetical protein
MDGFGEADTGVPDADAPADADFNMDGFGVADTGAPDAGAPADADFNMDGFGEADTGAPDAGAPADADFNMDGFGEADTGAPDAGAPADADFNMDGFGEADAGAPDAGPPADEDNEIPSVDAISEEEQSALGLPEGSSAPSEAAVNPADMPPDLTEEEKKQDPFDSFNLDGGPGEAEEIPSLDSFDIPGVDTPKTSAAVPEEKIEVFKLSEEKLAQVLETLSAYPINVRIACEEALAEQVIPPAQLNTLIKLLVSGGSAHEAARLVSKILNQHIVVPKSYKTGEELEEEQQSFSYIFAHKFLPIIRLFFLIALMAACVSYLVWQFIYKPIAADILYKKGYELILTADPSAYRRANQHFRDAFDIHRVKEWFYKYAERFRDEKQFNYAREKYDELLFYYPRDKKGALDYAALEADYLHNYEKADRLIRTEILDYKINDREGLLALGDINLDWAEIDSSRYEEARAAFARLLAIYGQTDPILERMLLYFIRTDKLFEVLPLQQRFMNNPKSIISSTTLAELGGYLLDKRLETPSGVPDENVERIEGIKDVLIRAERADPALPEPYYHLARYYNYYTAASEERYMLESAAAAFDKAIRETIKRTGYRIDNQRRLAKMMSEAGEFIPSENELVKGINIYEDAVSRNLLRRSPIYGQLYADLGDLEYFAKEGALQNAARYYLQSEANGWMPPEVQYRLGNIFYRQENYPAALQRFFNVSREIPLNRRLLYSMANTAFQNADYFTAEAYYKQLLDILMTEKARIPNVLPDGAPEHNDLIERLMWAQNNMGVTLYTLSTQRGRPEYRTRALVMFYEAIRSADALSRDRTTMIRPGLRDPHLPGTNLPFLNTQHVSYPTPGTTAQIFPGIDADVIEPSEWEDLMNRTLSALNR